MKPKAVVLLSAGLDSTVNLFWTAQKYQVELALTFDYGQKAGPAEVRSAQNLSRHLGVPHKVVPLPFFKDFNRSSLIVKEESIPVGSQVDINSLEVSTLTAQSVWVPNRNGIFLNIAAGFAEALNASTVVPGFNAEEATTFPDNSVGYMKALDHSFSFSTSNQVKVECFTANLTKPEIVRKGVELKVPFELMWPCYFAGAQWCGECESCKRSKNALSIAGVDATKWFAK